jgi:uncharacterized membrane protein
MKRWTPERPGERHPFWMALVLFLLLLPLLLALLYFNLAAHVFTLLGLSTLGAVLLLGLSLIGGLINIPLTRRRIVVASDPALDNLSPLLRWLLPYVYYSPPAVVEEVLAVNIGGAVVPIVFSAYLFTLPTTPRVMALCGIAVVTLIAKLLARRVPGRGVTLPTFIPPLVAAVTARGLVMLVGAPIADAAPVAYIAGTLGTLIGADLLNLPPVLRGTLIDADVGRAATADSLFDPKSPTDAGERQFIVSIGGAGVFDGIFLTGVVAPILAAL